MAHQRARVRRADRLRRLEVGVLLDRQHRPANDARVADAARHPEDDDDLPQPAPDDRHDRQQQQQAGERHPGVHEALHHQVDLAAQEAGGGADQQRHRRVDHRCRQPHQQRQPGTDDEAAQDIAANLIGAHQVLQRRPGEPVGQMPLGDRIGCYQVGEDGHQDQGEDHQGRRPDPGASWPARAGTRGPSRASQVASLALHW